MIEKFQGAANRRRLLDALRRQVIVEGNEVLAEKLFDSLELLEYQPEERIIEQGADDDDLYLLIAGRVSVSVHGKIIDFIKADDHFGEMSLIEPRARRSASIYAIEQSVVAKITEPTFTELADHFPILWRRIARCEAERVRARNAHIRTRTFGKLRFQFDVEGNLTIKENQVIYSFSSQDVLQAAAKTWVKLWILTEANYQDQVLCQSAHC